MMIQGDARRIPLASGSVDCCVTSPPYFGLRDYGHALQIGREDDPASYLAALVEVFEDVRRVLKTTGTLWVNLGDTYVGGGAGGGGSLGLATRIGSWSGILQRRRLPGGYKAKDLLGLPWALAFALRECGWYLRADNVWSKPNPMPCSAVDRPTISHEYVFLFAKSERYFFDWQAIAVPYAAATIRRGRSIRQVGRDGDVTRRDDGTAWDITAIERGRRPRSVWEVPATSFRGAHLATMPEKLVEPCILAGCPIGGLVLDPFLGSGTVGVVASRLGRRWVGLDLRYQELAGVRTAQRGLLFTDASA